MSELIPGHRFKRRDLQTAMGLERGQVDALVKKLNKFGIRRIIGKDVFRLVFCQLPDPIAGTNTSWDKLSLEELLFFCVCKRLNRKSEYWLDHSELPVVLEEKPPEYRADYRDSHPEEDFDSFVRIMLPEIEVPDDVPSPEANFFVELTHSVFREGATPVLVLFDETKFAPVDIKKRSEYRRYPYQDAAVVTDPHDVTEIAVSSLTQDSYFVALPLREVFSNPLRRLKDACPDIPIPQLPPARTATISEVSVWESEKRLLDIVRKSTGKVEVDVQSGRIEEVRHEEYVADASDLHTVLDGGDVESLRRTEGGWLLTRKVRTL